MGLVGGQEQRAKIHRWCLASDATSGVDTSDAAQWFWDNEVSASGSMVKSADGFCCSAADSTIGEAAKDSAGGGAAAGGAADSSVLLEGTGASMVEVSAGGAPSGPEFGGLAERT